MNGQKQFERLDIGVMKLGLSKSRSQAENLIKLGQVRVDGHVVTKPGFKLAPSSKVELIATERYVSRAGLKLASVAEELGLDFVNKTVLDVGSSTGGFTDYALQHGAKKVYAVDVGTDQLHPSLRTDKRVELYEKTDIRDFRLELAPDIIVIDVSFISLRQVLPHISKRLCGSGTSIVAMVKPQFEADRRQVNKGVIKNESVRRQILNDFEAWVKQYFVIKTKRDSDVAGQKGNRERFYHLSALNKALHKFA